MPERVQRISSSICIIINHKHTFTHAHTHTLSLSPPALLLLNGLTCHGRGMTATLSKREERKREKEGRRDVVSERMEGGKEWVSVEKERGDERQTVKRVQREVRRERQRKTATDQMCSLSIWSLVQWVQRERLFMLIYVFGLSSVIQVLILPFLRTVRKVFRSDQIMSGPGSQCQLLVTRIFNHHLCISISTSISISISMN